MITFTQKGNFDNFNSVMETFLNMFKMGELDKYGQQGVDALWNATPKKTGKTANSWTYEIERTNGNAKIVWKNTNVQNGVNIALLIQYGHGTNKGVYVQGRDYINPAIQKVFDEMALNLQEEVKSIG